MLSLIVLFIMTVFVVRFFSLRKRRYVIKYEYYGTILYYGIGKQTKGDTWYTNRFQCPTFTYHDGCRQIKYLKNIFNNDNFTLVRVYFK